MGPAVDEFLSNQNVIIVITCYDTTTRILFDGVRKHRRSLFFR